MLYSFIIAGLIDDYNTLFDESHIRRDNNKVGTTKDTFPDTFYMHKGLFSCFYFSRLI